MEFTTQLALHSQATRLGGSQRGDGMKAEKDGAVTLSVLAFHPSYSAVPMAEIL
jgi:hypothetical protein